MGVEPLRVVVEIGGEELGEGLIKEGPNLIGERILKHDT
jgi:hypothetical protein